VSVAALGAAPHYAKTSWPKPVHSSFCRSYAFSLLHSTQPWCTHISCVLCLILGVQSCFLSNKL
jgi:hypothetical protein